MPPGPTRSSPNTSVSLPRPSRFVVARRGLPPPLAPGSPSLLFQVYQVSCHGGGQVGFGSYMFAPSHAVESDVPLANILAFLEEAKAQRAAGGSAVVEQMAVDPPCDPPVDHGRIGPETAGPPRPQQLDLSRLIASRPRCPCGLPEPCRGGNCTLSGRSGPVQGGFARRNPGPGSGRSATKPPRTNRTSADRAAERPPELAPIRRCVARGQPHEGEQWVRRTAEQPRP